jgi:hypothetical protein
MLQIDLHSIKAYATDEYAMRFDDIVNINFFVLMWDEKH